MSARPADAAEQTSPDELFHPAVAAWFRGRFGEPTASQAQAWRAIASGRHTLVAAPTGSGKTLAAFLAELDALVRASLEGGGLDDATRVLYVSPLKALSNDIRENLQQPLTGIDEELAARGLPASGIRTWVRTGDTPRSERDAMRRRPPHVLVTTPESLYILLTSESGRRMLSTVRSVIVDEIHALAGSKRGSHLMLSLERLGALTGAPPVRIGLSATQKPVERMASLLTGAAGTEEPPCEIIDAGHARPRDVALEVPPAPLEAVMSAEVWEHVYDRLAELIGAHGTTLIFVNTRRMAERVTRHLAERLGEAAVTSHHGSLSRERRLAAERRLRAGELRALVATASLELGIDIGPVDLVCQLGSPRCIATLLQRVGRSGHALGGLPRGRVFPLSRDDLVECAALVASVRSGELDALSVPEAPLDVLAQQIVAEAACRDWDEDALFGLVRRARPYRELAREDFDAVVDMLARGFSTRRGRRGAYIHRDGVGRRLRGRRGARLAAVTCGGTIPDTADYDVVLEPQDTVVGSVNEDFAVESMVGDVFQLGNKSWRVLRVEQGRIRVADAEGAPPTIPFWIGEAPARTDELSEAVSALRRGIAEHLGPEPGQPDVAAATDWAEADLELPRAAAEQIAEYLGATRAALGVMPTREQVVLERFFDEAGDMHLVIHSPYGGRINRAWGLALRKRFCRRFNFELQAAATEDAIVLSLGATHSFALAEVADYLHPDSAREVLTQALLAAPMFDARWRWNATVALALQRVQRGRRVPAQLQRMAAEDLIAVVFPDQLACQENVPGDREIPDHPLVRQTVHDCLHEAMDVNGLLALLRAIRDGGVTVTAAELTEPSPLSQEILNARPYAFLDDAPLEERRTQAVASRRWLDPQSAADIGRLDETAIERVREEAWPQADSPDELHDALVTLGCLSAGEAEPHWEGYLASLVEAGRANRVEAEGRALWVAAERLPELRAAASQVRESPPLNVPAHLDHSPEPEDAATALLRSRLEGLGPVTEAELGSTLPLPASRVSQALARLESEGFAMRGRFSPGAEAEQWCDRRLLARIHRYTLGRLRREIEPVSSAELMRFLLRWQRLAPETRGEGAAALAGVLEQLEGFEVPAAAWESEILPARLEAYAPADLDDLCLSGRISWLRLVPPAPGGRRGRAPAPARNSPISLVPRRRLRAWRSLATAGAESAAAANLSARGERARQALAGEGALFFDELAEVTGMLRAELEDALAELVARAVATADSFQGLRAVCAPQRRPAGRRGRGQRPESGLEQAGRWTLLPAPAATDGERTASGFDAEAVEHLARVLLARYGVVFRKLLEREAEWLPPWRELVAVYRRLEACGEIRGGRFVAGFAGEQYALPEAVTALREARRRGERGEDVVVSAADPINLTGIVTPGPRLPRRRMNRVLYRDGVAIAIKTGREVHFLASLERGEQWRARTALLQGRARAHGPAGGARRASG